MIEIFLSYSHKDENLMNEVRKQLIVYEREGEILKWHDRMIPLGSFWEAEIDSRLLRAKVILLFMSPDFIDPKYCYEKEGNLAMARSVSGDAVVIPIVLRPCAWEKSPFSKLQILPEDGKPISTYENSDVATLEVALAIMERIKKIPAEVHPDQVRCMSKSDDGLGGRNYILNNTRQGGVADYKAWLDGYKETGGKVFEHEPPLKKSDFTNFRVAESEICLKPLYGNSSLELLILAQGKIKFLGDGVGHSKIYYMKGFTTNLNQVSDL